MEVKKTPFKGLYIIKPQVFNDNRGYFFESYNREKFVQAGLVNDFIQDNQSLSKKNVVRALHYQLEPYGQAKLIRVLRGIIYDVAVDIREHSDTFGKYFSIELSAENNLQLLIPSGFAHGFSVLSGEAEILYKCDKAYNKESERGIIYNDSFLNIDWKIPSEKIILSDKDKQLPDFKNAEKNFFEY